jgi:AcrR family transcriptional regulator
VREEGEEAEGRRVADGRRPPQSLSADRLPPGLHGIPPEQVEENQRWRLLGAAAEVLAERGCGRIRGADVCSRARVSRSTLYKYFEDLPACLLAAFEMTADCVLDLVATACEGGGEPAERSRAALDEVLEFLAEEPALANLLGPGAAAGVPAIAAARERLIERLALLGTDQRRVEGAFALVSERLAAGEASRLPELAPQINYLLVTGAPSTLTPDL